jgi:SAM-dependent methyltransferase
VVVSHPQLPGVLIEPTWRVLEIGPGPNKLLPQSVTLDISPAADPDVVHDLNCFPYPFTDDSFDLVICLHVLEHVDRLVEAVGEIHRALKPGGILFVEVPYFSSVHFFTDPTHRHAFTTRSFDYYLEETAVRRFEYSTARFEKMKVEIVVPGEGLFNRLARSWLNGHQHLYEERFAFIFPRHTLRFIMRAAKQGR